MSLSEHIQILRDDVRAILKNDPAARSIAEVLLYPGLHATLLYRLSHGLWKRNVPFIPRLISQIGRFLTGIEIHPGATIGRGFFIDHGMGVVIGETAEIGNWVMLYQGVTLGGTGKQRGKRHPTIQDDAIIGVGAIILGDITIGRGARIGGGAVVVKDVPPHSTAVGVPARIVAKRDPTTGVIRRIEILPDPEADMLRSLRARVIDLEQRLTELEDVTDHHKLEHEVGAHEPFTPNPWASLDENGLYDSDYTLGAGI